MSRHRTIEVCGESVVVTLIRPGAGAWEAIGVFRELTIHCVGYKTKQEAADGWLAQAKNADARGE